MKKPTFPDRLSRTSVGPPAALLAMSLMLLAACSPGPAALAESLGNPALIHGDIRLLTGETKATFSDLPPGRIAVPMTFGSKVLRIVLDTGWNANSLTLSDQAAQSIGYRPASVVNSHVPTEQKQAHLGELYTGSLAGVVLGPFEFRELTVTVKRDRSPSDGSLWGGPEDGIAGGHVLKYFTMILDQQAGALTLDLEGFPREGDQPLQQRWPKPYVNYFLDGKKRRGLIDTGTPYSIIVTSAFNISPYKASGRWFPGIGPIIRGISTSGSPGAADVILSKQVEILSNSIAMVKVYPSPLVNEGGHDLLGLDLFKGHVLRINYPRGLVGLE